MTNGSSIFTIESLSLFYTSYKIQNTMKHYFKLSWIKLNNIEHSSANIFRGLDATLFKTKLFPCWQLYRKCESWSSWEIRNIFLLKTHWLSKLRKVFAVLNCIYVFGNVWNNLITFRSTYSMHLFVLWTSL